MNISKRIVTLLMCIAMLLSMSTTFAFAAEDATNPQNVIDTPAIETEEEVETTVGASTFAPGPKPTSNVVLPAITNDTIVYDSTAKDDTYTLTFTDKSTNTAVDVSAWSAKYGTNLFSSLPNAIKAAQSGSGVVLMKNYAGNTSIVTAGKVAIYTEYYNVMPYIVDENDNTKWTLNPTFVNNAPHLNYGDIEAGGVDFSIFGIYLNNYFNINKATGDAIKFQLCNVYAPYKDIFVVYGLSGNQAGKPFNAPGSAVVFKNVWIAGYNWSSDIFNEFHADTIKFDGVYWGPTITNNDDSWVKQGPSTGKEEERSTELTFTNCNFDTVVYNFVFQGDKDPKVAVPSKFTRTLNFTNNVFRDTRLGTSNKNGTNKNAVISRVYMHAYTSVNVNDNIFISTDSSAVLFAAYDSSKYSSVLHFNGNLLNGVKPVVDGAEMGQTFKVGSTINNNFATATYAADLTNVEGVPVTVTNAQNIDPNVNFDSYFDAAGTTLRSELAITNIATENGALYIKNALGYSINWYKNNSGDASAIEISLPDGVTGKWYNAEGTEISATDVNAAGKYLYKTTNGTYTLTYTVTVSTCPANLFSDAWVNDGYIDGAKAIYLSNEESVVNAANGELVEVEWCGKNYSFIKGATAFASFMDIEFARRDNPHVLVKTNTEGNNFYPNFPGSFFTQNYKNNPVKKGVKVDGSDWAANIGTGEGQFNIATEVRYNNFGTTKTAPAGDYKFYGFTMTYSVCDYSPVANVYIENFYFNTKNWSSSNNLLYFQQKNVGETQNKIVIKNTYIDTQTEGNNHRLFASNQMLPEHFEFDTVYFDLDNDKLINENIHYDQAGNNSLLYVHDSCFKNFRYWEFTRKASKKVTPDVVKKDVWENNTLVNFYTNFQWNLAFGYHFDYLTDIEIIGNKVYNIDPYDGSGNGKGVYSYFFGSCAVATCSVADPELKLTIKDNYYQLQNNTRYGSLSTGKDSNGNLNPCRIFDTDALNITNNYVAANGTNGEGFRISYSTNTRTLYAKTWLITADGSNTSSKIQPFTYDGETMPENVTHYVELNAESIDLLSKFNLNNSTIAENNNTVKGYSDAEYKTEIDLANVSLSSANTKVYVKVFSPDGLVDEKHTINLVKKFAKIGEVYYPSFDAAYTAAQTGDTIELLTDATMSGKLTVTKNITIDGNGHSIKADETATWYTVSGSLNIKNYKTHLLGLNSDNIILKDVVLDCNNNAAGINIYCAQNVTFDNVSIINATKGMAALTVNGSTLTVKTAFTALGNSIALDISNGSGVTSKLGVTVEEGTVFDLGDKTVKFASVAENNVTNAVDAEGNPYFAAMDNAYFYTQNQINSRTTAYSNGLTLLADVELTKAISVKGELNLNGHILNLASEQAVLTAPVGLNITTNINSYYVVYEKIDDTKGTYKVQLAELPSVVITDVEDNPGLTFALNFGIENLDKLIEDEGYVKAIGERYGNPYVDYVLTIEGLTEESVTFNANGDADGYLAGQYDGEYGDWHGSWLSVPFEDVTMKDGESLYIMQYASEMLNQPGLRFTLAEVATVVKDFDCGIFFEPDFIAKNPNAKITLELKVFNEDENGTKEHYELNNSTRVFTFGEYVAAIVAEGKDTQVFKTVSGALEVAKAGEKVILLRDASDKYVIVTPGVTLDLVGNDLTADYVVAFKDSAIIDSLNTIDTTDIAEVGVLKVKQNQMSFAANENGLVLPVWDAELGGYVFVNVIMQSRTEDVQEDSFRFVLRPVFSKAANPYLNQRYLFDGGAEHDIQILAKISWVNEEGTEIEQYFSYSDARVVSAYSNNKALNITISGIKDLTNVTATAIIQSVTTGVQIAGESNTIK